MYKAEIRKHILRTEMQIQKVHIFSFRSKKTTGGKVERIEEDSLDLIPLPSVKIQIISGKVYLR